MRYLRPPPASRVLGGSACDADVDVDIDKVISFGFFLFFILVAQGLNLAMYLLYSNDIDEP